MVRKKSKRDLSKLIHELRAETLEAFASTGREMDVEEANVILRQVVAEVWPDYLRHALAKACGMDGEPAAQEGAEED